MLLYKSLDKLRILNNLLRNLTSRNFYSNYNITIFYYVGFSRYGLSPLIVAARFYMINRFNDSTLAQNLALDRLIHPQAAAEFLSELPESNN